MQERYPILDEILVIDSASTDDTREIAEAEGARVVQHPDVLPRYGSFKGKGEALWKSLYETTGDIVVWADTDVRNWHHRMVYGTLGPLLVEPRLQYVKGYYQRPIVEAGVLKEGGGGRVTELVARPLINLFFPELSGLIQPLSGEYAGRRSLLEQMPFFTGYAVEIGHLIDAAERAGLGGLGQVDLERRIHRNQELEGLSRMSFVILQAVMKRLEERRRARLFAELGSTMKLPRSGRGRLSLEVMELADHERPPMIRIPEYLERRRGAGPAPERRRLSPMAGRQAGRPDCAVLIAPDSYKGTLTSVEVARAIAAGWRRARPDDVVAAGAARRRRRGHAGRRRGVRRLACVATALVARPASGARSRPPGSPATTGRAAFVEMAAGVRALAADARTSAIRPARRRSAPASCCAPCWTPGSATIALGIGGSATTDGGAGVLRALGAEVGDDLDAVDLAGLDPRLAEVRLRIACDVTNPLLGPDGAAAVYGPQKGRDPGAGRLARRATGALGGRAGGRDGSTASATRRARARRAGSGSGCSRSPTGSRSCGSSRGSTS